jgi:hypothetical protein
VIDTVAQEVAVAAMAFADLDAGFAPTWTVEMDAALVQYVVERAAVQGTSTAKLTLLQLFDAPDSESSEVHEEARTPDKAALRRGVSVAPRYTTSQDDVPSPRAPSKATQLSDNSHAAIRGRLLVLRAWNRIVKPALRLIDLRRFEVHDHISQRLCRSKGRLLPESTTALIDRGLKLTKSGRNTPRVNIKLVAPGDTPFQFDSIFEQLFRQLHGKHSLTASSGSSEVQLFTVPSPRHKYPDRNPDLTDISLFESWYA